MSRTTPPSSELILNDDGSIYHLGILPQDLADDVILVGDPDRVAFISTHFDTLEIKKQNREFVTHTGSYRGKRLTVMSTGIGVNNIDIVINELDALVNIDLSTRQPLKARKSLNLVRIGTSGGLHPDIGLESFLVSNYAVGLDGLLHFYQWDPTDNEKALSEAVQSQLNISSPMPLPYAVKADEALMRRLEPEANTGITLTAPGFYAPQGRHLNLTPIWPTLHDAISKFSWSGLHLSNFEMESSAIYGLGRLLGHKSCSICCIIANRATGAFSKDHKAAVARLIAYTLRQLTD